MVPLSSAVHMDGSRPHLRGSLNALELGALAPVRPPFPKVVQALLGKGGWNQGSVRVSSVTCGFYDQTSWYLCCACTRCSTIRSIIDLNIYTVT